MDLLGRGDATASLADLVPEETMVLLEVWDLTALKVCPATLGSLALTERRVTVATLAPLEALDQWEQRDLMVSLELLGQLAVLGLGGRTGLRGPRETGAQLELQAPPDSPAHKVMEAPRERSAAPDRREKVATTDILELPETLENVETLDHLGSRACLVYLDKRARGVAVAQLASLELLVAKELLEPQA